jgi:hypothetical protein
MFFRFLSFGIALLRDSGIFVPGDYRYAVLPHLNASDLQPSGPSRLDGGGYVSLPESRSSASHIDLSTIKFPGLSRLIDRAGNRPRNSILDPV